MRPDELSSVLKQARLDAADFKIYVDVPQENKSSAMNRGMSPSTPKRSRVELLPQDSSFGDLSPIPGGSSVTPLSVGVDSQEATDQLGPLQTTPKRRRSLRSTAPTSLGSRSLTDLFSAVREETLNQMEDEDLSYPNSRGRRHSIVSRSVGDFTRTTTPYTPPRTRSQTARRQRHNSPPPAPRKKPLREIEDRSISPPPTPRRLDFSASPYSPPISFPIDYGAVMGIVGFVSSYLVRLDPSDTSPDVKMDDLAEFISTVSMTHRSRSSAIELVRSLAAAVPNWVTYTKEDGDTLKFNRSIKSFDVLSKLRAMKRRIQLNLDAEESQ